MKKLMFALFSVCLLSSVTEEAKAYKLDSGQLQTSIGAEKPITDWLGVRANYAHYWVPSEQTHYHFIYAGPTFNPTQWFWISPQIGYAGLWDNGEGDAYLASVWTLTLIKGGMVSLFTDSDVYFYRDKVDYYGFYSLDLNTGDWNIGIQGEQLNGLIAPGPHIGMTKGIFHFEVQFHFTDVGVNPRFFLSVNY